jgi:nitrite reductase/ring-hydroxylating ferredoxin subunit
MSGSSRTCVGVYRREVRATLERVWENVYDWEHLPWLHSRSFSRIELRDSGSWGWRAVVEPEPPNGLEMLIELVREGRENRYVARTLEGPGAGTEIWTTLVPAGDMTNVAVEFHVPGVAPEAVAQIGAAFTGLYERLWDEDEAMMIERSRRLSARGAATVGVGDWRDLGPADELRARLPLLLELGGRPWRIVAVGDGFACHATICPHRLGPLGECAVEAGRIRCPWHGYSFDVRTGASADGRRLALPPAPRVELDPVTTRVRLAF